MADLKGQAASGIAGMTIFIGWPMLNSVQQFTTLFEGNPLGLIIATLFSCVILAGVAGGITYRLLDMIENL